MMKRLQVKAKDIIHLSVYVKLFSPLSLALSNVLYLYKYRSSGH